MTYHYTYVRNTRVQNYDNKNYQLEHWSTGPVIHSGQDYKSGLVVSFTSKHMYPLPSDTEIMLQYLFKGVEILYAHKNVPIDAYSTISYNCQKEEQLSFSSEG